MAAAEDPHNPGYDPHSHPSSPEAIGVSEVFLEFQEQLSRVAKVNRPVLLIGERGTGKELAARRIHHLSQRWESPLVALNCAALSPTLIESELFGHSEGAFTGSRGARKGRFELADGGTLFLDEIGNVPMETQEKILRVVEYGGFEPVGSSRTIRVDVRIVGATNADLPKLAEMGEFKEDLLDRLSFEVLYLPPLRARKDDILLLANHFASRMSYELRRAEPPEFSTEAEQKLLVYSWPGNIRQLKNVIERAVYRTDQNLIEDIVFDPFRCPYPVASAQSNDSGEGRGAPPMLKSDDTFEDAVRDFTVTLIRSALEECKHNQKKAAERLGMTYHQFRWVYQKHKDLLQSEDDELSIL